MAKTLTAKYDTIEKARNALNDLVVTGFEREKVFLDPDHLLVKVITPNDVEREAREILGRHEPTEVGERTA